MINCELQIAMIKTTGKDLETKGNFPVQFSTQISLEFNCSKPAQLCILQQESERPKKRQKRSRLGKDQPFWLCGLHLSARSLLAQGFCLPIQPQKLFCSQLLSDYSMLGDCCSFALQILTQSFALRNLCGTMSINSIPISSPMPFRQVVARGQRNENKKLYMTDPASSNPLFQSMKFEFRPHYLGSVSSSPCGPHL